MRLAFLSPSWASASRMSRCIFLSFLSDGIMSAAIIARGMQAAHDQDVSVLWISVERKETARLTRCEKPEDPAPLGDQERAAEDEASNVCDLSARAKGREGDMLFFHPREEVDDEVQCGWDCCCGAHALDGAEDEERDLVLNESNAEREDANPGAGSRTQTTCDQGRPALGVAAEKDDSQPKDEHPLAAPEI